MHPRPAISHIYLLQGTQLANDTVSSIDGAWHSVDDIRRRVLSYQMSLTEASCPKVLAALMMIQNSVHTQSKIYICTVLFHITDAAGVCIIICSHLGQIEIDKC